MTKEESIKRLLFSEFDKSIEGADIYDHLGCKWIIFTNERKWIVEFTKERLLWFNYRHFNDIVVLFGMDCYEGCDYIKEWFERRFIFNHKVDNTIQNGVRSTSLDRNMNDFRVEDIIQNGVIRAESQTYSYSSLVGDTIQNGVIQVQSWRQKRSESVKHTIQNGVKNTQSFDGGCHSLVEDTIQNGVKRIHSTIYYDDEVVEDIIQNGIKT